MAIRHGAEDGDENEAEGASEVASRGRDRRPALRPRPGAVKQSSSDPRFFDLDDHDDHAPPQPATAAPIVIPDALKPADGRFGSGPSKVPSEAVRAMAEQAPFGTSHRQAPVRDLVARIRTGVGALLDLPDGYELLIGNGGSTAFWDAAAFGLVRDRAQHVVCGEFSSKFAAITAGAPFLGDPDVRRFAPGTGGAPEAADGIDVYAWPQNETSTGVCLPVERVQGPDFDGNGDALMMVDATSSAGAIATDLAQTDVYYFAPQKVFAAEGGLWLAAMSPAALARLDEIGAGRWVPPSLDLRLARTNSAANQTYNTPAIGSLWLMAHQTEWLLARGGVSMGQPAQRPVRGPAVPLGRAHRLRASVRHRRGAAQPGRRHHRHRRQHRRGRHRRGSARERRRRHRALPRPRAQSAANRHVPRRRPSRRRGPDRLHRLRCRSSAPLTGPRAANWRTRHDPGGSWAKSSVVSGAACSKVEPCVRCGSCLRAS